MSHQKLCLDIGEHRVGEADVVGGRLARLELGGEVEAVPLRRAPVAAEQPVAQTRREDGDEPDGVGLIAPARDLQEPLAVAGCAVVHEHDGPR
ncbi:MAG TPA: hypothetical protein VFG79_24185 [Solirubrobacter sp.]|nr:hypothetical protein [Solirubrobacter sp.]